MKAVQAHAVGWLQLCLYVSSTTAFLSGRAYWRGDSFFSVSILPILVLVGVHVAFWILAERRPLTERARKGALWAATAALGCWVVAIYVAWGLYVLMALASLGPGFGSSREGILTLGFFVLGFSLLFVAAIVTAWPFSKELAENLGEGPSWTVAGGTVALCVAAVLGVSPLEDLIKRQRKAAEDRRAAAEQEQARLRPQKLQDGCNAGTAADCRSLAHAVLEGKEAPRDVKRALALFSSACDAGDARACSQAAWLHSADADAPIDLPRAAALFDRACTLSSELESANRYSEFCEAAGRTYLDGRARNVPRALELLTRTCDLGVAASCAHLGVLSLEGALVPHDLPAAVRLLHKACDDVTIPMACYNLGRLYHTGTGVARDRAKAEHLYARACDYSNYQADKEACAAVERECQADAPRSCRAVADTFFTSDPRRAGALYERACEAGVAAACLRAGIVYENSLRGVPAARSRSKQLYKRACDLDPKNQGCGRAQTDNESDCGWSSASPMGASRIESCWQAGLGREKQIQTDGVNDFGGHLATAKRYFALACKADPTHQACAGLDRLCAGSARPEFCRQEAVR